MGAQLLLDTLPRWARGEIAPQPQDDALATTCKPIDKESGRLDWQQPAAYLARAVRAFAPWPGAYTFWNGKLLKIIAARALDGGPLPQQPGALVATPEGPAVVTGAGLLLLVQVQLEGRRALSAGEFVRGQRDFVGSRLE
jgi:methionyl-tRNA formyltransferase